MKKEFLLTASIIALILGLTTRCAHAAQFYRLVPLSTHHAALILIHNPHQSVVQCDTIGNGETSCKEVRISTRLFPIPHHNNQKARGEK